MGKITDRNQIGFKLKELNGKGIMVTVQEASGETTTGTVTGYTTGGYKSSTTGEIVKPAVSISYTEKGALYSPTIMIEDIVEIIVP